MDLLSIGITPEISENLYLGSEREMLWHCRSDPRFHYFAYVPESINSDNPPIYQVMCFVHGTGRTTEAYRKLFADFALKNNLIVLFPIFPGGLMDQNDYNSYKLISYNGVRYDLILLSMIEELASRYPVDGRKILLYGWSGGGQFVHRFFYVHPKRLRALCIGAPGRITYLDDEKDYYWGTRDFDKYFDKKPELDYMRKVPIMLMVGEDDDKFIGDSPYGDNRKKRILMLKENYEKFGMKPELQIIPNFEHKGNEEEKAKRVIAFFQRVIDGEVV